MRIFIAIQLDNHIKSHLNCMTKELMPYFSKARYTHPENYHITLKFIGEIGRDNFNKTIKAIKAAAAEIGKFMIWTKGVENFTKRNKHIFYCSTKDSVNLYNLYSVVDKELKNAGVIFNDGRFTPHITLAREVVLSDGHPKIGFEEKQIEVEAISVMESTRVNGKLTYIPRFTVKLKG